MRSRKTSKRVITIDDLNDKVAGRLAREAELARIRATAAIAPSAPSAKDATAGRRYPGPAQPANHTRKGARKGVIR